jgi:hypothetical protein
MSAWAFGEIGNLVTAGRAMEGSPPEPTGCGAVVIAFAKGLALSNAFPTMGEE